MKPSLLSLIWLCSPALSLGINDAPSLTELVLRQEYTQISSSTVTATASSTTILSTIAKPAPSYLALKRDWHIDGSKKENLKAEKNCKMMYTDSNVTTGNKPSRKINIAWLTMPEMKYPAIQLYNTDKLSKIQCLGTKEKPSKIIMEFNDKEAYEYAWTNWHDEVRAKEGDYLVITDAEGCWEGNGAAHERSFLRATTEERDNRTMSISCDVEPILFSDVVPAESLNDIQFGEFRPGNTPKGLDVENDAPNSQGGPSAGSFQKGLIDQSGDFDFDRAVDERVGRLSQESLARGPLADAGLTLEDFESENLPVDFSTANAGKIQARGLVKRKIGDRIKKAVKKAVAAVKKAVINVVQKITSSIVDATKKATETLNQFFTFDQTFATQSSLFNTIDSTNTVTTPFQGSKGVQLLSLGQDATFGKDSKAVQGKADVFCVECGFEGALVFSGAFKFSIAKGMEQANLGFKGNMDASFSLGVTGELGLKVSASANGTVQGIKPKAGQRKDTTKRLASISIADLILPGVMDIGPILSLDIGVDIGVGIEGKMLAGAILSWPAISANIDLKEAKNNQALGIVPEVTPIFEAEGEMSVTAGAFTALKLALGVSILDGKFDFTAGVQLQPRLELSATVGFKADLNGITLETQNGCRGIELGLTPKIEVNFVVFEGLPVEVSTPAIEPIILPGLNQCFTLIRKRSVSRRLALPRSVPMPSSILGNTTFDGGVLTTMGTPDDEFHLRWSPNGNVYAVEESKVPDDLRAKEWSGWFASDESGSTIVGDSHGRAFHGYIDTIQSLGVSRVRLHGAGEFPKTSWPVMFTAVIPDKNSEAATQDPILVISDFAENIYFPIICIYKSGTVYPKVFMANETEAGVKTLMSNTPAVIDTVTGEQVQECGYMSWTNYHSGEDISSVQ